MTTSKPTIAGRAGHLTTAATLAILIPLYVLLDRLGLQNSLVGLSLVFIMFQFPFALFMMRNSFEAVPRELEEAALVDGCTTFAALRRVLPPQRHSVRGFMSGAIRG